MSICLPTHNDYFTDAAVSATQHINGCIEKHSTKELIKRKIACKELTVH
jgi:hypothetical protein